MITELGDRLALIIDAKTDGAVTSIRKLSVEEKAAADRADVLKAKLAELETRAAKQASRPSGVSTSTSTQLSRTRSELAGLESNLAQVPAGAGAAERALAKLGLQGTITGSALSKGLAGAGVGLAVFGTFEFLKSGVENFTHLADEIRAVQNASSSSAEDSSKLVAITTALGVSSDVAALGVFRLGKNIDLTPEKLTNYGVAIARTRNGNVDLIGTLANVSEAYQRTQDPAKKAAIVYEAFGRAGTTMLPILNANADKLKEIAAEAAKQGRIFSSEDLASAKEYEITMRELADSMQAVGIVAGRTLVPALSKAAGLLTDVSDAVHSNNPVSRAARTGLTSIFQGIIEGPLHLLPGGLNPLSHLGGGGNGRAKAEQALAAADALATQQALEKAATATLGDASSILATPGQGLADAKQSLADSRQILADAVTARNRAAKDLATVRRGAPGADAASIEAAVARVHAAEAKLRAAQYVGGNARTSSAQATLLSAQDHLNKLRAQGGTDTNKLAAATERLHKANDAVANAQRKERDAQRARNQATGFSAADIQNQLTAQLRDKTSLAGAQQKLAGLGASRELIAYLDEQNQKTPGTLVKVAKGIDAGMVAGLNNIEQQVGFQTDLYAKIAGSPEAWAAAGADRAKSFADGFTQAAGRFGPNSGIPAPAAGRPYTPPVTPFHDRPLTFTGPLHVHGVEDPKKMAQKLAAEARQRALSGARL